MGIYPLKFEPIFKSRIWGGQRLKEVFGKDLPAGESIGESWELADLPDDKSIVINGLLAGKSIAEVMKSYPQEIFGGGKKPSQFPLLIKLLDAQDVLSVQVHPDAETCRAMENCDPKTECWYVIAADDNACIYKGLKKGTTRERFAEAIEDGTVEDYLEKVIVKEGECHFIPAGTAHAIGAGLLIAEIQTPSDTTFRVFDWNRVDADGRGRQLHVDQALESIHFDQEGPLPVMTEGRLVDCEFFKVDKYSQQAGSEYDISAAQLKTLMIIAGAGVIDSAGGGCDFKAGDTILIPAKLKAKMRFEKEAEFLEITL